MNREIRTINDCKQWDVDMEYVEITYGSVRIFMAPIDVCKDFDKKTAETLAAEAQKLNTRMFRILYTRSGESAKVANNCPKIVVHPLCCHKEIEIMREFRSLAIGWLSEGHRHEIYCGEDFIASIEQVAESLTYVTGRFTIADSVI